MKTIRVSIAALAAARKINFQSVGDVSVSTVADLIDQELAPALPLLRTLEVSLERGASLVEMTPTQRSLLEIDLANVRSTLHRLSPMNQELQEHE